MSDSIPVTVDAEGYPVHRETCGDCGGDGSCLYERDPGDPHTRVYREACDRCRGEGSILMDGCTCSLCVQICEDLERRNAAADLLPFVPVGVGR